MVGEQLEQRVHDRRVELLARLMEERLLCSELAEGSAVGTRAEHRDVRVGDRDDPRLQRNRLCAEPVRIARPVSAFVVRGDHRSELVQTVDRLDDLGTALGVQIHARPFGGVERRRLL